MLPDGREMDHVYINPFTSIMKADFNIGGYAQ
jgi:hypothetical protein